MKRFGAWIISLLQPSSQKQQEIAINKAKESFAHFQSVAKMRSLTTSEIVDYTKAIKTLNDYKENE